MGKHTYEMLRGKPIKVVRRERDRLIYWGDEILVQVHDFPRNRWNCVVHGALLQGAPRAVSGFATLADCIDYAMQARGYRDTSEFMTQDELNALARHGALKQFIEEHEPRCQDGLVPLAQLKTAAQEHYDQFRALRDERIPD